MNSRTIDVTTFQSAIALVNGARPTIAQRLTFWLFLLALSTFILVFLLYVTDHLPQTDETVEKVLGGLAIVIGLLGLLCLPLWRNVWRFRGAFRRLRLPPSIAQSIRRKRGGGFLATTAAWVILLFGLFLLGSAVHYVWEEHAAGPMDQEDWLLVAGVSSVALSFVGIWYLRIKYNHLMAFSRVFADADLQAVDGKIEIEPSDWGLLETLEKEQINREATSQSAREARDVKQSGGYGLLSSALVNAAKGAMELDARVAVQNQLVDLMANPRPEGTALCEDGRYRLPVSAAGVTICYAVDDDRREVKVYDLERKDDSA